MTRLLVVVAVLAISSTRQVEGQSQPTPSRRAVAAALAAVDRQDWPALVALLDPEAIEGFRRQRLMFAHAFSDRPPLEPDSSQSPRMPPAVTAYFDSVFADRENPILSEYPGTQTVEELDTLPARDLLLRYLDGVTIRPDPSDTSYHPPRYTRVVVGEVREADTLAFVIYQEHVDVGQYGETEQWHVVPTRRHRDGWRVLLNPDIVRAGCMAAFIRTTGPTPD